MVDVFILVRANPSLIFWREVISGIFLKRDNRCLPELNPGAIYTEILLLICPKIHGVIMRWARSVFGLRSEINFARDENSWSS